MKINGIYYLKPRPKGSTVGLKQWADKWSNWHFIGSMTDAAASAFTTGKNPKKIKVIPLDSNENITAAQGLAAINALLSSVAMEKVDGVLTDDEKTAIGL